jgi:hypothetical protein
MLPTALYEIAPALHEALTAEEFDDATIDALAIAFEDKAKGIIHLSFNLDGLIAQAKAEEARIANIRKAAEARNERILAYLKRCMEVAEIAKLPLGTVTASIQNNPPKVVIDDEFQLPQFFVKTVTTQTVDKKLIAEAIKAGEKVPGAHIEQGTSLRIR